MSNLVDQLRELSNHIRDDMNAKLVYEAADEIGRLRMEIVRLSTEMAEDLMVTDRLRYLINAWVDADDDDDGPDGVYHAAWLALRKAVGR